MAGPEANRNDQLEEEALGRLAQLRAADDPAVEAADFAAWRARSPAHADAARNAETLWREIGETPTAQAFAAVATGTLAQSLRTPRGRRPVSRRLFLGGALAASAAAVVAGTAQVAPIDGLLSDHVTTIGERRRFALPDGSIAHLNSRSALSVHYQATERRVALDAGEAVFEVDPDDGRPFLADAAGGATRAQGAAWAFGTTFGLRQEESSVRLYVAAGSVDLEVGQGSATALSEGFGISYGRNGPITRPEPVDVASVTAWQRGKLVFNRRPLHEVVRELERYRLGRIAITDPALRNLPVTGVFDLDDAEEPVTTIAEIFQVELTRLPLLTLIG